jgi:hypothetical protein
MIAFDMIRRGLPVAPVLVVLGALLDGTAGALSAAFAIALVLVNLAWTAVALAWAARTSLTMLAIVSFGGYILRLVLLTAAVLLTNSAWWFSGWPFGLALIVTHLGLLIWETRYVSTSLAYPGLKPTKGLLGRKPA